MKDQTETVNMRPAEVLYEIPRSPEKWRDQTSIIRKHRSNDIRATRGPKVITTSKGSPEQEDQDS